MSPRKFLAPSSDAAASALNRFWVELGTNVRDGRMARRWDLALLAKTAGVSRSVAYEVEAGRSHSIEAAVRLTTALGLRLEGNLIDPRRKAARQARDADPVHAFMGEFEVRALRLPGYRSGMDEPYQHYQFSGRADVVVWDLDARALLHIENRTRFPDFQDAAGSFNAKRAYLGAAIADRLGLRKWESETHVVAALWSSEVLHSLRMRPDSFRSLCPDSPDHLMSWWMGRPPSWGKTSALIVLDPLAHVRQRRWISLENAINGARPRHRGYADVAAKIAGLRSAA